jgi:hypothetical protein
MNLKEIAEGLTCEKCNYRYRKDSVYSWESDLYVYFDLSGATRIFCTEHILRTKNGSDIIGTFEDNDTVCYGAKLLSEILDNEETNK